MQAKTTFYKDENGQWRWRIKKGRHIIGASTEGYHNRKEARGNYFDQGITMFQSVIRIIAPEMSDPKLRELFINSKIKTFIILFVIGIVFLGCKMIPVIPSSEIEAKTQLIYTNMIAIDTLKQNLWQDPQGITHSGGLYPSGLNVPPQAHGSRILKATNKLNDNIGMVTIGASNCMYESYEFSNLVDSFTRVKFVNAAIGGKSLEKILQNNYWVQVHNKVLEAGLIDNDVQVVILESASFDEMIDTASFVDYTNFVADLLTDVCNKILIEFPKCQLIYLPGIVSTQYALLPEYAKFSEPWSYYTCWANKFLIQRQIEGDIQSICSGSGKVSPVLAWMNPNWSDGIMENSFGFSWDINDVFPSYPGSIENGVHPSITGAQKVANYWYNFFINDPYALNWFY